jgi:hypothetical protein
MSSQRSFQGLWVYILFLLLILFAFTTQIGNGWYFHNDGVTIACSMESIQNLIHPGKWEVLGCTYDHQPVYQLLVKAFGGLLGYDLIIYQWLNLLFYYLAWLVLTRQLAKKHNLFLAGAVGYFFLCSTSVVYWLLEIRMYPLYLLSCFFIIAEFERTNEKVPWWKWLAHLVSYFNFFAYVFPLALYLIVRLKRLGIKDTATISFTVLFGLLFILKLPFVLWWRMVMRQGGQSLHPEEVFKVLGSGLFQGTTSFQLLGWMMVGISLLWLFTKFKQEQRWAYLLMLLCPLALMLIGSSLLELHEIELRYFIFVYPILIVLCMSALDSIKNKMLVGTLGLILIFIGTMNARTLPLRGEHAIGEIKSSAEFLANHGWKDQRIWVDQKYWFYAYLGVYSEVLTSHKSNFEVLVDKKPESGLYVSVLQTLADHEASLRAHKLNYKIIWNEKNFLGMHTIISEIKADNQPE